MSMCKARREGDQMCCGRCGTAWDVKDPEPPECRMGVRAVSTRTEGVGRLWLERMRGILR